MHKKRVLFLIPVLAVILCVAIFFGLRSGSDGSAGLSGNLIKNGSFSELSGDLPSEWETGMWVTSPGASFLEVVTLEDGINAAFIENAAPNDARFEQTVTVTPETIYLFSALVRAEGCGDGIGANLSFLGIYGTSTDLYDTGGDWERVTLYVETGKGQKEATAAIRLGGYGSENTGKAWFRDVRLETVDSVPVGMSVMSIATAAPASAANESSSASSGFSLAPIPSLILISLAWAVLTLALLYFFGAGSGTNSGHLILVILLLSFLLRLILSFQIPGYGVDIGCFSAWAAKMASSGPMTFYEEGYFCDYPPAYMLVLGLLGTLVNLFGIGYSGMGIQALLKLVPELCDIGLACMVYRLFRKDGRERIGLILAALFALNPAYIITSSCWGQIDSLAALLILLFLLAARDGRWQRAIPLFALAVLTKPQAGLLAPLGIFALAKEIRLPESRKRMGLGLLLGIGVTLAIALPFSPSQNSPLWLAEKYISTLGSYNYATLSTGNLMFLLGGNWTETATPVLGPLTYGQLGTALMILSMCVGVFVYMRGKERQNLFLASALTIQLIFVLGVKMHERYVLSALLLMLLAYLETGDLRCLLASVLSSAASAVNIGTVLAYDYLIAPNLWLGYLIGFVQLASAVLLVSCAVSRLRGHAPLALPVRIPDQAAGATAGATAGRPEDEASSSRPQQLYNAHLREELKNGGGGIVHLRRLDVVLMLVMTLAYACVAFYHLGATKAPQTGYISSATGEQVVIDLGQSYKDYHIYYYGGISDTQFTFCTSDDPDSFDELTAVEAYFDRGECFKWQAMRRPILDPATGVATGASGDMLSFSGRYILITFDGAGSSLWEVAAVDADGQCLGAVSATASGALAGREADPMTLIDEQGTVPYKPSYENSMYFDEIYHARTGYEHAHSLSTYETTHPPLGKVFMSLCIRLMGMTPFAWRFAGTLTGILMLPALYLLALQLLGKTRYAALATFLMAVDCMHFTQTRIATIDSFPVLFMMLMFLFMVRWMRKDFFRTSMPKLLVELAFSGIFLGLAIASKWIGCYGAVGLALLFFSRVLSLYHQYLYACRHEEESPDCHLAASVFPRRMITTLLMCILFFVVVPVVIYVLSYIPYLSAYGEVKWNLRTLQRVWDAQVLMYDYHANLVADHYFSSPWYEWPLIIKPMWYYTAPFPAAGMASTIMAFGNPAVWWTSLIGILFILVYSVRRNLLPALHVLSIREDPLDRMMPVVVIGFLSAYLPWVLVSRLTFIYHYFASVPFIILGLCMTLAYLERHAPRAVRIFTIVLCAVALLLFIGFYPLASGLEVPRSWCDFMNWFPGWMWY